MSDHPRTDSQQILLRGEFSDGLRPVAILCVNDETAAIVLKRCVNAGQEQRDLIMAQMGVREEKS